MNDFFNVTVLAILQGIAEFLPISSSGHLVLAQGALGVNAPGIRLDVFLHVGTVGAICWYYRQKVSTLVAGLFARDATSRTAAWLYAGKVVLSAVPAIVVYFLFKSALENLFENARAVGGCLVFTGFVLTVTRFLPNGLNVIGFGRAFLMGLAQALALMPGISRSGMTLVAARAAHTAPDHAAEFSFLMSVPLILGAALLEVIKSVSGTPAVDGTPEFGWLCVIYGAVLAAVIGYFSLALLVRTLRSQKFWLFGPYCILVGLVAVLYF